MKTRTNVILMLIASLVVTLSLASCEFDNIAKSMNGTWTGKSVKTNDDQSKEHLTIYFKFNYDEKSGNDGGTYIEVRNVQVENYETLMDDNINISYQSYIEETWTVTEDGELAMKPDLNTLKVSVDPNDKDIEKDIFSNLHTEYSVIYDKDVPFSDLQVQGDKMSFVSYMDEKTSLQKTDVDIMSKFSPSTEPAKSETESSANEEETFKEAPTGNSSDDEETEENDNTSDAEDEGNYDEQ